MASPRSFHTPMLLAILLVIACVAYGTAPARADDAVVGSGSPASCTEIAFDTALNTVQLSGRGDDFVQLRRCAAHHHLHGAKIDQHRHNYPWRRYYRAQRRQHNCTVSGICRLQAGA